MRTLNLGEIQKIKEMAKPEGLRRCGVAFSVASTYVPTLCDMAEEYLRTRAVGNIYGHRKIYALDGDSTSGWVIKGSDGFSMPMGIGESSRDACVKLIERLNGVC
jgi:hypothetical protein